jgi:flagellar biosynthetic protein FliR
MLVFVRIAGIVFFNPIMSRSNVPRMAKTGLVLLSSILIAPITTVSPDFRADAVSLVISVGKELFVGFVLAYIFNVFYYMIFTAGDILDMQFGFSMAKVMDPGSNVQSAVTGNLVHIFFIGYIFATNTHALLIRLVVYSYSVIPVGAGNIVIESLPEFIFEMFNTAFLMIVHLAFPFVAVEFIVEMCLGIMMKLIPQIHVFVINMQLKIIISIVMLYLLAEPISGFMDNYISSMFSYMQNVLKLISGS